MSTIWVKYKHQFAWGQDKEWTYKELNEDELRAYENDIGEMLMDYGVGSQHEYSDKYRGSEYHRCENNLPPKNEIKRRWINHENSAEYHAKQAVRFKTLLDEMDFIKVEDVEV
jgi:hypothetical protein